jgi:hypothetical protein
VTQDDQDQIAANTSHSPPAEMIQQDENAESSEEELSIRFDMDIEGKRPFY